MKKTWNKKQVRPLPFMQSYWINAWRTFRQCRSLMSTPAWSATNLTAAAGTSWTDAGLVFRALNIAAGTNETWNGPATR